MFKKSGDAKVIGEPIETKKKEDDATRKLKVDKEKKEDKEEK